MKRIAIVGGGVIGLATAYFLRKQNHEVILIDKGVPGQGCSRGNMGWICPSLSHPVPAPGLVGQSMKWMLNRKGPLYVKPSAVPHLTPWLLEFTKYCTEDAFKRGTKAMIDLCSTAFTLFDGLEEDGVAIEMHRNGILKVFLQESEVEESALEHSLSAQNGFPKPELITSEKLQNMEPNLSPKLACGLYYPMERHVRPESLSKGLSAWLQANGATIKHHTEIAKVIKSYDRVEAIQSATESIEADIFLMATGAWSAMLGDHFGMSIPITAGKGYSITISEPTITFRQPIYFGSDGGITPFNGALRMGGTMELSGINTDIDQKRVQNIRRSLEKYVRYEIKGQDELVWTGMRPMTPDGLPMLGRAPHLSNAYIAAGHAMEGITMSLSTGKVMGDMINGDTPALDLTPFAPSRFKKLA